MKRTKPSNIGRNALGRLMRRMSARVGGTAVMPYSYDECAAAIRREVFNIIRNTSVAPIHEFIYICSNNLYGVRNATWRM